ncbi:unnamed protein product [Amoebophrya sp. A25]|nr:unnamed protein product [Amoebophrya sp. A25]|eukprot:GSA25T00025957001.1
MTGTSSNFRFPRLPDFIIPPSASFWLLILTCFASPSIAFRIFVVCPVVQLRGEGIFIMENVKSVACAAVGVAGQALLGGVPAVSTTLAASGIAISYTDRKIDALRHELREEMKTQLSENAKIMEKKVQKTMQKQTRGHFLAKKAQAMGDRSWFDNQQVRVKNIVLKHFNTKKKSALRAALREIKEQKPGCGDVPCKVLMTLANLLHVKSITGKSTWKTKAEVVDDLLAVI